MTENASWIPEETIGDRLVVLRRRYAEREGLPRPISQKEACLLSGVSPRVWEGVEAGRGTRHLERVAKKISAAFEVNPAWLLLGMDRTSQLFRRAPVPLG